MAGQRGRRKARIFSVDIRKRIDKLARPLGHAQTMGFAHVAQLVRARR